MARRSRRHNDRRGSAQAQDVTARAELGIIAEAAGHEIARKAHVKYLDLSAVRAGLASIGAITGVRSTPTPAAALRRAARRHLRGVSQKGVM
jgi:hypothetical protein